MVAVILFFFKYRMANVDESLLDVTDEDMDTGETGKTKKRLQDQDKDKSFAGSSTSLDSQCPQELPLLYKVIRGNRLSTLKVIDSTGEEKEQDEFGSFKDSETGTKDKVVYRHLSSGNRNISLSFDPTECCAGAREEKATRCLWLSRTGAPRNTRHRLCS